MAHLSLPQSFLVLVSNPTVSLQSACPLSPLFSLPRQHLAGLQPTIILSLTTNSTHRAVFFLRCVPEHGAEAAKGFSNVNAGRPPFVHSVYTRRPPGTGFVFGSVFYSVGTGGSVCPRDRSTNWKRKEKKTIRPAFSRAPPGRQAGARRSRPLPRRWPVRMRQNRVKYRELERQADPSASGLPGSSPRVRVVRISWGGFPGGRRRCSIWPRALALHRL